MSHATVQELMVSLGFTPLPLPFRHVQALGGSFHCATLDIRRDRVPSGRASPLA